jgi:hypothetical protein
VWLTCKYLLSSFLLTVLCPGLLCAQAVQRELSVQKRSETFSIDGVLNEPDWQRSQQAKQFTQSGPRPGEASLQKTSVSILYDDEAVYVGAMLYEQYPDSIVKQLSPRDDFENSNTDAFAVTFDTYFDRQNATQFAVTAAGVQADAIVKFDAVDRSWNAAWYSRVHHSDSGWSVEMKIPYSALRFPKKEIQQWGVNFLRIIRRHRERSFWNPVNPTVTNVIAQSGKLTGINDIKAPLRLALLPYFSAYAEDYDGATAQTLNGGMDVKYGVSESFTLDMTLVPDFGQTLFDNRVLNLSPIEVRYDERRYFFTEGVDLFNKNDLFYSRRVGGTPVNLKFLNSSLDTNEVVTRNPATTRLYNAAKFSGRTGKKTGIGIFNAVSAQSLATITDTVSDTQRKIQTAPFTNYNVLVVDQALKNNSYISLVNTNVSRKENSYDANVSALLFKFADKANRYGVSGSADVSQLIYPGNTDVGYRGMLNFGKQSGNYTWSVQTKAISDRFNPNDLGYLDRNNIISAVCYNIYNTYKPFWKINTTYNKVGLEYYRAFNPEAFAKSAMHGNHVVTFSNFLTMGSYWDAQPGDAYDFFEPRTPGRFFVIGPNNMFGGFVSSDYRKRFALDLESSKRWYAGSSREAFSWEVSPRVRFSNKLSAIYSFSNLHHNGDIGFVNRVNDSVYLGTRNLRTSVNTLTTAYIFTRTMSLRLDARHYWSQAAYSKYGMLGTDGKLNSTAYNTNHNINYNSFNMFMNFVWQFKPGSEMSVVYQNSIYSSGQNLIQQYYNDLQHTFQAPQSNSLSVKIIYFLDYLTIEKAIHRKHDS